MNYILGLFFIIVEGILSNYVSYANIPFKIFLLYLFLLILAVINKKINYKELIILTLIYDVFYTNIYFLTTMIYIISFFIYEKMSFNNKSNLLNITMNISTFIVVNIFINSLFYKISLNYFISYLIPLLIVNTIVGISLFLVIKFKNKNIIN